MKTISNHILTVTVSSHGAELVSIKKSPNARNRSTRQTNSDTEYLWQGDDANGTHFWNRHNPILFPVVGRLWNDTYRVGDAQYHLPQHGFARDSEFQFVDSLTPTRQKNSLTLQLESNENTHAVYPYDFVLQVNYKLYESTVIAIWSIVNKGPNIMYFQIGAHPAILYPNFNVNDLVHAHLVWNYPRESKKMTLLGESGCCLQKYGKIEPTDAVLPLTDNTFEKGALVKESSLGYLTMLTPDKSPYVSVICSKADVWGIWAPNKPNCPFVCLEPWCGRADDEGFEGDISQRKYIKALAPNSKFMFQYGI